MLKLCDIYFFKIKCAVITDQYPFQDKQYYQTILYFKCVYVIIVHLCFVSIVSFCQYNYTEESSGRCNIL